MSDDSFGDTELQTGLMAPNCKPFPCGEITHIHTIQGIEIAEYEQARKGPLGEILFAEGEDKTLFHPYLTDEDGIEVTDLHRSFDSLDDAIMYAVIYKKLGGSGEARWAHNFIIRMLSPEADRGGHD